MIGIDFPYENVVALTPQGALTEEDFDRVARAIDDHINERDVVPNILVHVMGIPHWASLSAMSRHFHFVKEHQRLVKKVALVHQVMIYLLVRPRMLKIVLPVVISGYKLKWMLVIRRLKKTFMIHLHRIVLKHKKHQSFISAFE